MKDLFNLRSLIPKLILFSILSIALMVSDHRYNYLDKPLYHLRLFGHSIHYLANLPTRGSLWLHDYIKDRALILGQNERMRHENLQLNARLQQFTALQRENRHLRKLLQSPTDTSRRKVVIAELVGVNMAPFEQQFVINKGSRDNAYPGQPVLGAKGVIGQVTSVTPLNATVTLISNPGHALLGQIERSGLRVLVLGTGNAERLKLLYVPTTANIRETDVITTSGLDGRYPANYPVGQVTQIEREAGDSFATISVKPIANLGHNREVLLTWPHPPAAQAQ